MALAARLRAVHTQNPGACVHYMRLYNQVVDIQYITRLIPRII
jgi:hypothetical protein